MKKNKTLTEKDFNNAVIGTQARYAGHFSMQHGDGMLFSNYVSFQQSTKGNLVTTAIIFRGDFIKLLPSNIRAFFNELLYKE